VKDYLLWLCRDESGKGTVEYSLVFALIGFTFLVFSATAVSMVRSQKTVYAAVVIPSGASFDPEDWSSGSRFKEEHYRISQLADRWGIGRETVRLLVKDEPGVLKIRQGRKKAHTTYSVPESVAKRIHNRLENPD